MTTRQQKDESARTVRKSRAEELLRRGPVIGLDNGFPKGEPQWSNLPTTIRYFAEEDAWSERHVGKCIIALSKHLPPDERTSCDITNWYGDDYLLDPDGVGWANGRDGGDDVSDRFKLFDSTYSALHYACYERGVRSRTSSIAVFQLIEVENDLVPPPSLCVQPVVRLDCVPPQENDKGVIGPVCYLPDKTRFSLKRWLEWAIETQVA